MSDHFSLLPQDNNNFLKNTDSLPKKRLNTDQKLPNGPRSLKTDPLGSTALDEASFFIRLHVKKISFLGALEVV